MLHFPLHLICSIYWIELQDCSTFIFFPWTCSWKFLSSWCYALLWQWTAKNKSFGDSICSIYWMAQYVMPKISSFSKFGSGKCWSKAFRGEVWTNILESKYIFVLWRLIYPILERDKGEWWDCRPKIQFTRKVREAGRVGPGDMARSAANRIGFFLCDMEGGSNWVYNIETQYLLLKHYRLFKGTFWEGKGGSIIRERTQEACSGCWRKHRVAFISSYCRLRWEKFPSQVEDKGPVEEVEESKCSRNSNLELFLQLQREKGGGGM